MLMSCSFTKRCRDLRASRHFAVFGVSTFDERSFYMEPLCQTRQMYFEL